MDRPNLQKIKAGIAAYDYEQRVLLRLLRFKGGSFTSEEFDRWFSRPPKRRWVRARYHPPDGFIGLGCDMGGFSWWALWLELLQFLAQLGNVEMEKTGSGRVLYHLAAGTDGEGGR